MFQFCLTITEPFSPIYLEKMKNYQSLSVSLTVSQLVIRVRKPTVAYKLVLQEKTQEENLINYYKNNKNIKQLNKDQLKHATIKCSR